MNYYVMTLFPELITNAMNESIMGRAAKKNIISVEAVNIRDYAQNVHRQVDDYIYGGGSGMLMQAEPVWLAYQDIIKKTGKKDTRVLYMSPQGRTFNQSYAQALSKNENIIFLCGHYEGIDERVIEMINPCEVSLGDFVLTGGELAAMVMTDAVSRMVPGVLSNEESGVDESFSEIRPLKEMTKRARREVYGNLLPKEEEETLQLLEYPQYTRPEVFMGQKVPDVLLSGNHAEILKWRRARSIERTKERRPDLLS